MSLAGVAGGLDHDVGGFHHCHSTTSYFQTQVVARQPERPLWAGRTSAATSLRAESSLTPMGAATSLIRYVTTNVLKHATAAFPAREPRNCKSRQHGSCYWRCPPGSAPGTTHRCRHSQAEDEHGGDRVQGSQAVARSIDGNKHPGDELNDDKHSCLLYTSDAADE